MKETSTKKQLSKESLYLTVFKLLKQGKRPSSICEDLNIKKQKLNYYIASLKKNGFIEKVGYGVWKILKNYEVQSTNKQLVNSLKKRGRVRGHGFQFTLNLPKLSGWKNRREILKKNEINFKVLDNIFGGAELINFKGRKIILTNKSLIINEKASYFADNSHVSKSYAVHEFYKLLRSLEIYLKSKFSHKDGYKFRISRQHYALVKNELAKQYDDEGKKLHVTFLDEEWLLIDRSLREDELETVHPKTAVTDNEKVQNFFNGIKKYKEYTPELVITSIGKVTDNQIMFAENMKSHINAINELADGVKALTKKVGELK